MSLLRSAPPLLLVSALCLLVGGCKERGGTGSSQDGSDGGDDRVSRTLVAPDPEADAALAAEVDAWHAEREERLKAERGWLSLVGMHWLEEGEPTVVGSAEDADFQLPADAPEKVGTFLRLGEKVRFSSGGGVHVTRNGEPFGAGIVRADTSEAPDVLEVGRFTIHPIARQDRLGLRVKDPQATKRTEFEGVPRYPVRAGWRVEGRYVPFETPQEVEIPTAIGTVEKVLAEGAIEVEVGGRRIVLTPLEANEEGFFFAFGDETNRDETYGGGRFLSAEAPDAEGKVVLDFNRAYSPPCAFTPFATCPLPPERNKLALRVEAGERRMDPVSARASKPTEGASADDPSGEPSAAQEPTTTP